MPPRLQTILRLGLVRLEVAQDVRNKAVTPLPGVLMYMSVDLVKSLRVARSFLRTKFASEITEADKTVELRVGLIGKAR